MNNKMPFFRGKTDFSIFKKTKSKNKNKQNKEGLEPNEVALWATSSDP